MIHRFTALLFFLLLLLYSNRPVNAQSADPDPTRWINYRQTYYKIPVVETGLYRVSATDLQRAGVPVEQLKPVSLQLFHRGVEQPIFVAGEADGRFDADDYLEFQGRGNDGVPDSLLYQPQNAQPHPFYSLFSDTTAYFLTWRLDGKPGKRITFNTDTTSAGLTPEPYRWAEDRRLFTNDYPGWPNGLPQKIEYSYYEAGEGYTGGIQQKDKPLDLTLQLDNPVRIGPESQLELLFVGRDTGPHRVYCLIGESGGKSQLIDSVRFDGFTNARIRHTVPWSFIGPDGRLPVSVISTGEGVTDNYSVSYRYIRYPQKPTANQPPKPIPALLPVTFTDWINRQPTYLIISHERLMKSAVGTANAVQSYAGYRASAAGGGHDTLIVTMQQLIDQYNYGERSPLAISRFLRELYNQPKNRLQHLLLLGRGRSTPGIRHNPQQATLDMVMTAGYPGSDGLFSAGLNPAEPDVPVLSTGRINAGTPQEVMDYLNKVREYEHPNNAGIWRKNLLHLSGGRSADELVLFRKLVDTYRNQAVGVGLGARVTTLSKTTDNLVEKMDVAMPVNEGVGLITFFGHSGLDVTDLDIGFCSNDAFGYRNAGKYPVLFVNGCAIGNFFFGRPTLATDWVLTPNRGAIAAIAQSNLGYADVLDAYTTNFYSVLSDSSQLDKSIGEIQRETFRRVLAKTTDGRALANAQQMVLQGDPAIRPFPFATPDYVLTTGGLTILGANRQPLTALSDSVQIGAVVQNAGQYRRGPLPVRVRRWANGQEAGTYNLTLPNTVAYRDTLTVTLPNSREATGENQFEVIINPEDRPDVLPELDHKNNGASTTLLVPGAAPVLIYPPNGSLVNATTIRLTAQYLGGGTHPFDLEIDSTARFDSPFRQVDRIQAGNTISYVARLINQPNQPYFWRVRLAGSQPGVWTTGLFTYLPAAINGGLPEGQIWLANALPADNRQGDELPVPVRFVNLSPVAFADSLVVRQTVYAAGLANPQTTQWFVNPPAGADTLRFTARIATQNLPGLNRVVLTVNPRIQPEYSFLNNTLDFPLYVQPDHFGPLLDVAFDGAHISDGAVVSARPVLDVVVADENRSLIRHDTTGLLLWLQRPGMPGERLSWGKAAIQPAGPDNVYRLRYPLTQLPDGMYQLLLTAQDALGNAAVPYRVSFRVINTRELIGLTVYPNPFQEHTIFSFTLTGDAAPASATITIADLTGRVLRHLNRLPRIGRNELVWDGSSDAGALLPAGEYVYKLTLPGATDWLGLGAPAGRLSGRVLLTR